MDCDRGLSEEKHEEGICQADARELHGVGVGEGSDAFEQQLSHVGVLALVALQRHTQEPDADVADDS